MCSPVYVLICEGNHVDALFACFVVDLGGFCVLYGEFTIVG